MAGTQDPRTVSTKLRRIAEVARINREQPLTNLAHHIDYEWLLEAHARTRKDGATGVDGLGADDYARDLEGNLRSLLERFKSGTYRAPPVRRVHIPKGDGSKTRPIGIPTFEDKVLQRAVVMALNEVYEQAFMDCSYGFRPGRSQHMAIEALWKGLMRMGGGWVLEVDIKAYFDSLDHAHLRAILDKRVRDGVLRRMIDKWLKAGVWEEGVLARSEEGSPQGGVISPLLANIYLHDVLDVWFANDVIPKLRGPAFLIRFADDFVIVCKHEEDVRRIFDVLPKRFGKFGLTIHPEKTKIVRFKCPRKNSEGKGTDEDGEPPGTFDLLGFTHYWGRSKKGNWVVRRKTAASRFRRTLKAISDWCRQHRHLRISEQHDTLCKKINGHMNYYGITHNVRAIANWIQEVRRIWKRWLGRRAQHSRMSWARFGRILEHCPLPGPRIPKSAVRVS